MTPLGPRLPSHSAPKCQPLPPSDRQRLAPSSTWIFREKQSFPCARVKHPASCFLIFPPLNLSACDGNREFNEGQAADARGHPSLPGRALCPRRTPAAALHLSPSCWGWKLLGARAALLFAQHIARRPSHADRLQVF